MDASDVVDFALEQGVEPIYKILSVTIVVENAPRRDYIADLRQFIPSMGFFRDILIIRQINLNMVRRGMFVPKFIDWSEHFEHWQGKTTLGSFDSVLHCGLNNTTIKLILPKLPLQSTPHFLFWASIGELLAFAPEERLLVPLEGHLPFLSTRGFGPATWKQAAVESLLLPHVDEEGLYFQDYTSNHQLRVG